MAHAHVDAEQGVTGEMLLGALVDAGASMERVEAAVATLGGGAVRLAWGRVPRGDTTACSVRVRAPEWTPDVPSWTRMREVLTYAALEDTVRDHALEAVRRLVSAEAASGGLAIEDLDMSQVGVLDTMALVVAVCTCVHELALDRITIGPIGLGSGTVDTLAGPIAVPSPAVDHLLVGFTTRPLPDAAEATTATGACLVSTLAERGMADPPAEVGRVGVGAGPRDDGGARVLRVLLGTTTTAEPSGPSG